MFQFGNLMTYNIFVSLGLITAVPVSAGMYIFIPCLVIGKFVKYIFKYISHLALDVVLYGVEFEGMKLAGIILITVGFFLVMFPDNWPDYIMRLLR